MLLSLRKNFILAGGRIVGKRICITKGNRDWLKKANKTWRTFLVQWNHNGLARCCWGLKNVMVFARPVLSVGCHPWAQKLQLRGPRAPQGWGVNLCLLSPWMMQDRSFSKAADSSCCVGKRVMTPLTLPRESLGIFFGRGWLKDPGRDREERTSPLKSNISASPILPPKLEV